MTDGPGARNVPEPDPVPAEEAVEDARVLVVDDEPANVVLLRKILERAGFHAVRTLTDPREALDAYADLAPDIVLTDLSMPHLDGFALITALQEAGAGRDLVPVVVLTADDQPQNRLRALALGAQDYLLKPFHPEEVLLRVRNLLRVRQAHRRQLDLGRRLGELVAERTRSLDEARTFLAALVDCLDVAVLASDVDGTPRLANEATRRLGIRPSGRDDAGSPPAIRLRDPQGRVLSDHEQPLRRATRGESVDALDLTLRDEAGQEHAVVVNARPIRDGDRTLGAVMAVHEVTERRRVEAELRRLALHDALTGLPNRTLLLDRLRVALAHAARTGQPLAVLFLDLDDFKMINESLSHADGDLVLMAMADRMRGILRDGDTAARFAGDEFVVLCGELVDADQADALAERLGRVLAEPVTVSSGAVTPHVSIGVTVAVDGSRTAAELVRDADTAMLAAKRRGGGRHEVFVQSLRRDVLERVGLEAALHRALEAEELQIWFQPTIDLDARTVRGAEALLRWRLGDDWIAPDRFIPVAERSGLITLIGDWVLHRVCARMSDWVDRGLVGPEFTVAVNVAARQLSQPAFAERVEEALAASHLPAGRLCLEITETALIEEPDLARRSLIDLRDRGVSIAVDDFGTGQSSLMYLRTFPIEVVKVDRSFVTGLPDDPSDAAIVTSVVDLGRRLGLRTLAEGVETAAQAHVLREMGCAEAQGYLFAQAMDGALLPGWIERWQHGAALAPR